MSPSPELARPSLQSGFITDLQPRHLVVALVVLSLAAGLTRVTNALFRRAMEHHRARGTLLPETATRLQASRRLLSVAIWLVGVGMALSQFQELRVLSAGLLASAGLSGLIVGFAARSTLGNAIAGVTIAFAQPVRIGDDIELRGERGTVEDINLLFSVLRLADGKRLIIPNDTLSTEVLKNLTLGGVTRVARTEVLVPPRADALAVRRALLDVANGFDGLDRNAAPPEVYFVRLNELGVLLRLVATCADGPAADRLGQRVLERAVTLVQAHA